MKINNFKLPGILALGLLVSALWTEVRCSEEIDEIDTSSSFPAAYFEIGFTVTDKIIVIKLIEENKIIHARKILSGEITRGTSIEGTIVKKPADYNPGWSYHLAPRSIDFMQIGFEVGDASPVDIEEHLNEVGGSLLPGNLWKAWHSKILREKDNLFL